MPNYKKDLWEGNFNYQGQMFQEHRYAYSKKHSFWLFTHILAEKIGISREAVSRYFSDPTKDNHRIERITKKGKVKESKKSCQQHKDA